MSLTAVALGATGLVGSELIRLLLQSEQYSHVIAITRRPIAIENDKLKNFVIDFGMLDQIADKVKGDVLFSCLGTTKKQAGSIAAQRVVDLDYQLKVAEFAAANGMRHYCLVSSSSANAGSSFAYMKMKGELEQAVIKLGFNRTSIFQPSLLLGPREQSRISEDIGVDILSLLCRLPGLNRYRPIEGREVSEKMLQVSLQEDEGVKIYSLEQVFP